MSRLKLPPPSDDYYHFLLKIDLISMMQEQGFLVTDLEYRIATHNPDVVGDLQERFALFQKNYQDRHGNITRSMLDKTYKHADKNILDTKVVFSTKDKAKEFKAAIFTENMKQQRDEPGVVQITKHIYFITAEKVPDDQRVKSYDNTYVKYILDKQLTFDPREHNFGTKIMNKLSDEDARAFRNQPEMIGKSINKILTTDPYIFRLGVSARVGDIIQIRRENVFMAQPSTSVTYREVTKPLPVSTKNEESIDVNETLF